MDEYAKFVAAAAALIGAVAWPAAVLVIVFVFRNGLNSALSKIPVVLDRAKKASLPGIALELERVADAEVRGDADKTGKITSQQIDAAARIAVQSSEVSPRLLLEELDRLCLEYDNLRRTLPPGDIRTRGMTRIIVKMRSLAPISWTI